ncbi:molybdopterin-dependent oxidoreductase [Arcobacteraceae bacterium]|nr:molybdopterin-dependent oxidoreductase [Arcobacteraceae bacterium]
MSAGENIRHDSANTHVTGKSAFIDDRVMMHGEVFVGIITSKCAKGKLKSIDFSKALEVSGVIAGYKASDFVSNSWGTIVHDQPLLVDEQVSHFDEPLALLACENKESFDLAKGLVGVVIEEEEATLSLDVAIEKKEFLYTATSFKRGDEPLEIIKKSQFFLEGDFFSGGQEHFYLESQSSIAYPLDDGGIEIHSSSQHSTETQHVVAHALGLPLNKVACIVKRMGGGFGGKESQPAAFAAYSALIAKKLNRSARVVLTKDDDMKTTGKRHPVKTFYKISFDEKGKITAFWADIYSDGGAFTDVSPSILERTMFHIDGAYFLPSVCINASACKTNYPSNTAFRGFGGPQGTIIIESIIEDIASTLGIDALKVREVNCYRDENNITPYHQVVENNTLPELFTQLKKDSSYEKRREEINLFNKQNKGVLKGLSFTAVKFGIAFTARHLNQGNALVNIHLDGTIEASTGATEMGQGVNTKIAQIISEVFGLDATKVKMMATSTQRNANTSPTAASSGSDINGAAAHKASLLIKKRLQNVAWRKMNDFPFSTNEEYSLEDIEKSTRLEFINGMIIDKVENKQISFEETINIAYLNRISLCDYSHFRTEGLGFDKTIGKGKAFNYFTNGVVVTEVSVDEYTGEMKVLKSDILMDLGRMINPGIDEGQVCGAFVQGQGWVSMENLCYSVKGELLTHSPTTYKIPTIQDIPREFTINFIENDTTDMNVRRSKAVGEPPFLLGISVFTACKNALSYRSKDTKIVSMNSPATNENLLMKLEELKA